MNRALDKPAEQVELTGADKRAGDFQMAGLMRRTNPQGIKLRTVALHLRRWDVREGS
jgi:hypothetical protein